MEIALIVFRQTVVMFLYMFAGYVMFRTEKMTIKGSRDIASLLVWLVIPAVIVNSFCVERTWDKAVELFQCTLITVAGLIISIIIARLIYRNKPVEHFGAAFSNAGFIGIPLVQAAFGDKAVFWIVPLVALMNMLQWSYGVRIITGEKSATGLKHLIVNPILVGTMIGLAVFASGVPFDMLHGGATVLFLWLLSDTMREKLLRIRKKYGILYQV
jgi:predicted permease